MLMSCVWTGIVILSIFFGLTSGTVGAVGTAAMDGAAAAVDFMLATGGTICLWCGVMEVMEQCGISGALSKFMSPVLKKLFPGAAAKPEIMSALSKNVSANILGLGNAATPMGIKAAKGLAEISGGTASKELCLLVVLNTASIQLLPTTVAAVRAACGSAAPFDILPAVWISSVISVTAGLSASFVFSHICK